MADLDSSTPRRAVVLIAKIEADTRKDMVSHLLNLATQIERDELGALSIFGGYSSGHILQYSEGDLPTHDEYFRHLVDHLAAVKESENG